MISKWTRGKLGLTDRRLRALRSGCPDFDEDDVVVHVRSCDACTSTILAPSVGFAPEVIARMADPDRLEKLTGRPMPPHGRYTKDVPCPGCGGEIFGTFQPGGRGVYWANVLNGDPHDCTESRERPVEVDPWLVARRRYATQPKRVSE
jgi:hypothetical protein